MKRLILFCTLVLSFSLLSAQQVIELNSLPNPPDIKWENSEGESLFPNGTDRIVANVSKPTLMAYIPDPSKANGTALIIAPGGGFHFLSIDNEGDAVAKWCMEQGIAAFVLRYRLVPTFGNPMQEFMTKLQASQEDMDREMAPIIALANADGLAAIQHVRSHADDFGINPSQVGIVGFSAGGTVAAAAAFEYSSEVDRPDFTAPIYAALHVVNTQELPDEPMPMFMAVTADDVFGFQYLSADLFKQWGSASHPVELHIYEKGGHGFGMRKQNLPSDKWVDAFASWMGDHGWLKN